MKIIIAGGAGFIGSHLTEHCLSLGHEVLVIDTLKVGRLKNLKNCFGFKFLKTDGRYYEHTIAADLIFDLTGDMHSLQNMLDNGCKVITLNSYPQDAPHLLRAKCGTVYGPRMHPVYSEASTFIYITDLCKALVMYGTSNITNYAVLNGTDACSAETFNRLVLNYEFGRSEPTDFDVFNVPLLNSIGFTPEVSLKQGLRLMVLEQMLERCNHISIMGNVIKSERKKLNLLPMLVQQANDNPNAMTEIVGFACVKLLTALTANDS